MEEIIFWMAALIILLVWEVFTLGLTTIWFAFGALIAAIAAMLGAPIPVQAFLFLVISVLTLIFTRPIAMKYFNRTRIRTNANSLIGQQAIVTQDINNIEGKGQAIVNGQEWTARAIDNRMTINKGEVVVICQISGVKLIVNRQQPYQPNQS